MSEPLTVPQKIKTGLIAAAVLILVIVVGAEAYSAFNAGGMMRMEVIEKVLDTLTSLMGSPPEPTEAKE